MGNHTKKKLLIIRRAPWGPKGEQKCLKIQFLRKELIFNLFQKSGMLLKPKYLNFGAMRNLGNSVFTKRINFLPFSKIGNVIKTQIFAFRGHAQPWSFGLTKKRINNKN